ncbi:sugar ABC transporter ATP-binding protein [Sneathiella sp. HT1-7]|uniref:sugar ABC transporter ATP-binding protein n=1 Tax=Sneathiella sp. HT1-7 TaxID=2887192 RepID=UPI001D15A3EF|nr:sugar ABC transporter ATP-binding protein [Sneathiella sp. HT1-7]MCC3305153.1 sugar ABC transporter ATP-binding protein [Sneathiella sp. HT1-7]
MNENTTPKPIIEIKGATKIYGGVHAIENVSFDLYPGEIHALAGENGAGKSTLCKSMAGTIKLTSGSIYINGEERSFADPGEALDVGIAMVYQETSLVPSMSVAQNLRLGKEQFLTRMRGLYIEGQVMLQTLNFHVDPTLSVSMLGAAQRQMVEIARAVYHDAKVIIFDEPTATLTPEEKQHFFDLVRDLKARGVAIIYVSHALEESLEISDRITVLRDGKHIVTDETGNMSRDDLVRHMVGRSEEQTIYHHEGSSGTTSGVAKKKKKMLTVENVTMGNMVKNMSFSAYEGEIAVLAGLVGSGRTEIAKIIVGAYKRNLFHGGRIFLDGKAVRYRVPKQAVDDGIVYITEDRKVEGFLETMSINDNIYLSWLASKLGSSFLVSKKQRNTLGPEMVKKMAVRAPSGETRVNELSGGNQQKVVVAKSVVQRPKLVIFDEPTRGVDVGSIPEIHQIIRDLAAEGVTVLVISSYLPEVMALADRVLVARQGRIVEEFNSTDVTEEKIMYAAVH